MSRVVSTFFRVAPAFPTFVSVSIVDTGRPVSPCDHCDIELGLIGVHWKPGNGSTAVGLAQVGPKCAEAAVEFAAADCLPNTAVRVEFDLHAQSMPIPLRSAA
jgi:hypothetical protein